MVCVLTPAQYKSSLVSGVTAELAATEHAGLLQYTFPTSNTSNVVVDVSHVLPSFRGLGWSQGYAGGALNTNGTTYTGHGIYNNGWNLSPNWTIYFCGQFDQKTSSYKTFTGNGTTLYSYGNGSSTSGDVRQGAVFTFDNTTAVTSRVGISFISSDRACSNVQAEVPKGTAMQSLVTKAQDRWNSQALSKVTTTNTNTTALTQLYSYIYGMMLLPTNRTGENPLWTSSEPSYDDIITFWDLSRCGTALMQVLQPVAFEEQIRSIIDIWRHEGWLPDARSSFYTGRTQGGSNADNVLADAYVKGVRGAVNWQDGYAAMKTDADVTPPNNFDPVAPDSSTKEGRGALPDWKNRGYITLDYTRSVTRAIEYSVNDFGLSQVAYGLNETSDGEYYLNRSRQWRNHWQANSSSFGFSGFLMPIYANGSFESNYSYSCGGEYWGDPCYEDTLWAYSWNGQHDIAHLIDLVGGNTTFVNRLEKFFEPGVYSSNTAYNEMLFNPGNEPAFNTPYLYNYVGRQDLSVYHSRQTILDYYGIDANGLPGNSDAGAMQTWALWNMIGLYPMTTQTTFLIGSPFFEDLSIDLGGGKTLRVTSTGGNPYEEYYVQSLKVNGVQWDKAWLTWEDVFESGGTLEFVLGAEAVMWATGVPPPSPATVGA